MEEAVDRGGKVSIGFVIFVICDDYRGKEGRKFFFRMILGRWFLG